MGPIDQALPGDQKFGRRFHAKHTKDLLARRVAEGWIRDVHGDLHAEHICFAPEGIQIFDCIEFSAKLRRCDLAAEIAFLSMDLCVRGGESLVEPFIARYREVWTIPICHACCRFSNATALSCAPRCTPCGWASGTTKPARYFNFAQRFTWQPFQPFLVLICGFTGSGKSTWRAQLGERLGMTVINSDETRKRIAGKQGSEMCR